MRTALRARYQQARFGAGVAITVDLVLTAIKAVVGVLWGSYGLLADALNSLSDVLTSAIVMVALWYSERPADANHPYGHARAEAIAATLVSGLLVFSGLVISWIGIQRLLEPAPVPGLPALWVAASVIVVKELLFRYKIRLAQRTGSRSTEADAWNHRSDALSSIAVVAGLLLTRVQATWWWADPLAGLVVGLLITVTGVRVLLGPLRDLMDEQPEGNLRFRIRSTIAGVDGILGIEKVWIRRAGLEYSVDVHVEVDPEITVREGHEIAHQVIDRVREHLAEVRNLQVHVEPAPAPRGAAKAGPVASAAPTRTPAGGSSPRG